MARPTDPAKLAALRKRQAIASANYRARTKAALRGTAIPKHAVKKAPARYRPPTTIVERAAAQADRQRKKRADVLRSLPSVRNPKSNLRPMEETERKIYDRKTAVGKLRQAEAIREHAAAQRIQTVGKARQEQLRNELKSGPTADMLRKRLTKKQQKEFQEYSEIIASGSAQSVAIFMDHAAGQGKYSSVIERILASEGGVDIEGGLNALAALAKQAQEAAVMYSPERIGKITV